MCKRGRACEWGGVSLWKKSWKKDRTCAQPTVCPGARAPPSNYIRDERFILVSARARARPRAAPRAAPRPPNRFRNTNGFRLHPPPDKVRAPSLRSQRVSAYSSSVRAAAARPDPRGFGRAAHICRAAKCAPRGLPPLRRRRHEADVATFRLLSIWGTRPTTLRERDGRIDPLRNASANFFWRRCNFPVRRRPNLDTVSYATCTLLVLRRTHPIVYRLSSIHPTP